MPNNTNLHGNQNAVMDAKLRALLALQFLRTHPAHVGEKAQTSYLKYKGPVLNAVTNDDAIVCYQLFLLYTANYFIGAWAHQHATTTADGRSVYAPQPTELSAGSWRNDANELVGTQTCATLKAGIFSSALTFAFQGNLNDKALELVKFACGLLTTSVKINQTLYPENSICTGASGSLDSYHGIRNDGLSKLFFDQLTEEFNMKARLWVSCNSELESNLLSHMGYTMLDYGSYFASLIISAYAIYKVLEQAYHFANQSLERLKEWRANQTWYSNNLAATSV